MKPKEFLEQIDETRLLSAIAEAEGKSSGEIRVYVSHRHRTDPLTFAQARFLKLGMTKTAQRNGVLIYFAPRTQQFAVVGDVGVHEKCGDQFWQQVTAKMTPLLKAGAYTDAIVAAIEAIGDVLARHFPRRPGDKDELSNEIIRD